MSETQYFRIFNLPQDIIFNILSRLPTKSLIQFQHVCTSSPLLISHPSFINLHLSPPSATADNHLLIYSLNQSHSLRSPTTFQETLKLQIPYKIQHGYLQLVGSNKGLLCFFDTNYYSTLGLVILWNPCIQKFKKIDNLSYEFYHKVSHFVIGFGFVLREFEFKVVMIAYYSNKTEISNNVFVYSLNTNSWKKKDEIIAPCYLSKGWSSNVFVNGFVNWLGSKDVISDVYNGIMAFELENESFRVLELPENIVPNYHQVNLASHGESEFLSLSLCAHYFEVNGEKWDMWVMGEYGVADSWKKVCVVTVPILRTPPLLMKSDHEVLIVMNDGRVMLFDARENEMRDLETCGLPRNFRAIGYTASLALHQTNI